MIEGIYSFGGIALIIFAGIIFLFYTLDKRFPPVHICVWDKGVRSTKMYRLVGTAIVKDNLLKLLLADFTDYCGDVRYLEADLVRKTKLFGTWQSVSKIYRAYNRYDYLTGLFIEPDNENKPVELIDRNSLTIEGNKFKMKLSKDTLLIPMRIQFSNDKLAEHEVSTGKEIAARFIESKRSTQAFIQASNPLIAVLVASIPMLIIIGLTMITLFLGFQGIMDVLDRTAQLQSCGV